MSDFIPALFRSLLLSKNLFSQTLTHITQALISFCRLIVSVLHTNSVFSWFLLMCSPFGPTLTGNQNVPKKTLVGDSSGLQNKPRLWGSLRADEIKLWLTPVGYPGDKNGLVSKTLDQETTGSGDKNELTPTVMTRGLFPRKRKVIPWGTAFVFTES